MTKQYLFYAIVGVVVGAAFFVQIAFLSKESPQDSFQQNLSTSEKEVAFSYRALDPAISQTISRFEEDQDLLWQGTGFLDDRFAFSGKTSLALTSTNHKSGIAFVDGLQSFGNVDHLDVVVRTTDAKDFESLIVLIGTEEVPHAYRFLITDVRERWNIVRMPKNQFLTSGDDEKTTLPSWNEVTRVEFQLLSRPGKTVIVNIDNLRAERTATYVDDWNSEVPNMLGLDNLEGSVHLLGRGIGSSFATMVKVPSAFNFRYRAQVVPLSDEASGLFFRGDFRTGFGYTFWIGGVGKSTWGVTARGGSLLEDILGGELNNIRFRDGQPVWMEIETSGETITASLSLDGKSFNRLGTIADGTFDSGGVGIYVEDAGETLFNDFIFQQ